MGIVGNKTDKFVKALEVAMTAAKNIPGLDVSWKVSYTGPKSIAEDLTTKVEAVKQKFKEPVKEPVKEEIVTSVTEG